ncbi:MAG TPA: transcriptional regulator NrdR [Acidimicrobiales bacterium]|nr:transcriptional regulator NrdR [Acidimicrobiales bacterium]
MRCPNCSGTDDHVIDSREADGGEAVRRRRECRRCGFRFTTFERIGSAVPIVVKRSEEREPFQREKLIAGVRSACKNRPVDDEAIEALASAVEDEIRMLGREVTTEQIGVAVLEHLKELDEVAYIRFASVYKGFENLGDFEKEAGLLTKSTAPKRHSAGARPRVG